MTWSTARSAGSPARRTVCACWTVALSALLAFACARPARVEYEQRLATAADATTHALHSERLRQLMRSVQRYSDSRLPVGMDTEAESRSRVADIVTVAEGMAASATMVLELAPGLGLDPTEREQFERLAATMRRRALDLAADAGNLSTAELRGRMAAIDETCSACHERFRSPLAE